MERLGGINGWSAARLPARFGFNAAGTWAAALSLFFLISLTGCQPRLEAPAVQYDDDQVEALRGMLDEEEW